MCSFLFHVERFSWEFIGLISNLKSASAPMHRLYLILKARLDTNPQAIVSEEEIELAAGRKVLNPNQATEYIKKLEVAAENIVRAFEKQAADAAV